MVSRVTKYDNLVDRLRLAAQGCVVESVKDSLLKDSLRAITELISDNFQLKDILDARDPHRKELANIEKSISGIYDILMYRSEV